MEDIKYNDLAIIEKYFDDCLNKEEKLFFKLRMNDHAFRNELLHYARMIDHLENIERERLKLFLNS